MPFAPCSYFLLDHALYFLKINRILRSIRVWKTRVYIQVYTYFFPDISSTLERMQTRGHRLSTAAASPVRTLDLYPALGSAISFVLQFSSNVRKNKTARRCAVSSVRLTLLDKQTPWGMIYTKYTTKYKVIFISYSDRTTTA